MQGWLLDDETSYNQSDAINRQSESRDCGPAPPPKKIHENWSLSLKHIFILPDE